MREDKVKLLLVQFKNEIMHEEIPLFRGAINACMENANVLFHNHLSDDTLLYHYPLIQYKRINNRASLICIGEGTEAIGQFFSCYEQDIRLGNRTIRLEIDQIRADQILVQEWDTMFSYTIRKWLPLNSHNYADYLRLEGMVEKVSFLEKILVGNILSFCKGLGIMAERQIECQITNLLAERTYVHKGVKLQGFDVEFKCNVSLPNFVGLGKGVSHGYGMIKRNSKK